MNIRRFNESSNFNDLVEDVKTAFSFLVDDGCKLSFKGDNEVYIYYDAPVLNQEINKDIDKYIIWVDKLSNIANDMKVSVERLKSTHDISYHFYNKVDFNRSRISLTINLISDDLFKAEKRGDSEMVIFNLPSIRKKFYISKDITIRVLYWTEGYTLNFDKLTLHKDDAHELIKFMKTVPHFQGFHYTKTGTLVFKFDTYVYINGK
jgi:hypothetical protein